MAPVTEKLKPRFTLDELRKLADQDGRIACQVVASPREKFPTWWSAGKPWAPGTHDDVRLTPEEVLQMEVDRTHHRIGLVCNPKAMQGAPLLTGLPDDEQIALEGFRTTKERFRGDLARRRIEYVTPTEQQLLEAFRTGDHDALSGVLYQRFGPRDRRDRHDTGAGLNRAPETGVGAPRVPETADVHRAPYTHAPAPIEASLPPVEPERGPEPSSRPERVPSPEQEQVPPTSGAPAVPAPAGGTVEHKAELPKDPPAEPAPKPGEQPRGRRDLGTGRGGNR